MNQKDHFCYNLDILNFFGIRGVFLGFISKQIRELVDHLPKEMKYSLYRSMVKIPANLDSDIIFKIAETKDEVEQSLRLLYQAYAEFSLTEPDPDQIRVTVYHTLPTTSILLAKHKDKVIGTLSLIRDNPLGLPAESHYDLSYLRNQNYELAETSSLAIDREWRGKIFFHLLKFFYEYSQKYFHIDSVVLTTHSKWYQFYEALLLFEALPGGPIEKYDFANGVRAVGEHLDLRTAPDRFYETYAGQDIPRDLYSFFVLKKCDNFLFPERPAQKSFDSYLSPEIFKFLFQVKPFLLDKLSPKSLSQILSIYQTTGYIDYVPKKYQVLAQSSEIKRRHFRFPVLMYGELVKDSSMAEIKILEVSGSGARIFSSVPLVPKQKITLRVQYTSFNILDIEAIVVWGSTMNEYGIEVTDNSKNKWLQAQKNLESAS